MSQVNVNPGSAPVREDTGDRTAAAGINFATVLIVLAVVVAVLWFLFSGPVGTLFRGGNVDVNINTPAQTQPAAPSAPNVTNPASGAPASKP
ncbi:MAG: hypothetical protein IT306_03065 [Chloroflexi bacterium]|nr:hypothetical protein [Chloroflexota bacterium]